MQEWEQLQYYSMINLFTPSKVCRKIVNTVRGSIISKFGFEERLLGKKGMQRGSPYLLQKFMDKHQESNRASVRKAIIEHEKMFKYQVQELHRLYNTQKILMARSSPHESESPPNADRWQVFETKIDPFRADPSTSDSTNSSCMITRKHISTSPAQTHKLVSSSRRSINQEKFNQEKLAAVKENEIDLTLSIGSSSARRG